MTFEQWMVKVDQWISKGLCGFTSSDLADIAYRDLFEDGLTPIQAAREAIQNEGM